MPGKINNDQNERFKEAELPFIEENYPAEAETANKKGKLFVVESKVYLRANNKEELFHLLKLIRKNARGFFTGHPLYTALADRADVAEVVDGD